MNLILILITLLNLFGGEDYILFKGKIVFKDLDVKEGVPGVEIHFPDENIKTYSNTEGMFQIRLPKKDLYKIIVFKYAEMPTIHLSEVYTQGNDTVDLGNVELILNKSISAQEFSNYKKKSPLKIKPIYHNAELLGYYITDEVEEKDLVSNCKDKNGNLYHYQYDSEKNMIQISYNKINECR